jgi:hypothetical protein
VLVTELRPQQRLFRAHAREEQREHQECDRQGN